jgi:hypothetical protein
VAQPRYALAAGVEDVLEFADRFPVVIKPLCSTLGSGVHRIDSAREAAQWASAQSRPNDLVRRCAIFAEMAGLEMGCDPGRHFLVEEYVDAPPFETDGLVIDDHVDCFGVTEQVLSPAPNFWIEGYLFPADGADLSAVTRRALRACRVRDMGFSVEFRGDRVIEVNGRLGEDPGFPDLFQAALGKYPILKWLELDTSPSRPTQSAAIAYVNRRGDGTVRSASVPPGVHPLTIPGQRVASLDTPHLAYALETDPSSSRAAYERARARVGQACFDIR